MAYGAVPSGTEGMKVPFSTSDMFGYTVKKLTKKHIAIVLIKNAKNAYKVK